MVTISTVSNFRAPSGWGSQGEAAVRGQALGEERWRQVRPDCRVGPGEGDSSVIPINLNGWEGAVPATGVRGSEGTLGCGRREPGRFWKGDFSGTCRAGARGPEHLTKAKGVLGDTYGSSWSLDLLERRRVCLVGKCSGPFLQNGGWAGAGNGRRD